MKTSAQPCVGNKQSGLSIEGLKRYCTASNAYRVGSRGRHLAPVCEADIDRLEAANARGLRWHELGREIASVENEISFINGELDGLAADNPGRASLISTRSFLRLRLLRLEAQRARFRF